MLPVMPWVDTILEQFETVDRFTTDESEYHGPYNTLTDLFPHTEHYQVTPQYKRLITAASIDFTMIYMIVRQRKCPVFFIEIKPFPHIDEMSTRSKADRQVRD